jgi:membrane-associated phospholipid phosphatase
MKKGIFVALMGLIVSWGNAQQNDSLFTNRDTAIIQPKYFFNDALKKMTERRQRISSLIIPGALITYGFVSIGNDGLKKINQEVKEEVWSEHPHQLRHLDNFLKFAPAISVYALNAAGIHGKNNLRDRTMIYLLTNMMTNGFVFSLKKITHQLRPDGSAFTSFPSGHAAEAFASAEFLRQEYKDVSPWYGVAGYAMAFTTGYYRLYNNKHWLGDVVAGAGFGIASTKIAYWLYPKIKKWLFKEKPGNTALMPVYQNKSFGFALVHNF